MLVSRRGAQACRTSGSRFDEWLLLDDMTIHGLNAPVCFGLLTASAIVLGRHFLSLERPDGSAECPSAGLQLASRRLWSHGLFRH
jgi:hypothetical protein